MSASGKSAAVTTRGAGRPSTPKSISKVSRDRRNAIGMLPNLTEIFDAFSDARALVTVACELILQNIDPGSAATVLRLGVEALDGVSDQLEKAEMQLGRIRRKNASALGGVP
jgi:hypothetical protein